MRRLGLVVIALLLAGCGSSSKDVARQFYEAFERHEFSKAKSYVCTELYDEIDVWIRESGDQQLNVEFDVKYEEEDASGSEATIQVSGTRKVSQQSYPVDYTMRLEKRDGDWKVCDMQ
ncbi:MAG TPA: hypothetical protein VHP83_22430 [Aggregatilineaceae bacterium]|nr:hypothetical protein [Aggregatilineaceae bacterium]